MGNDDDDDDFSRCHMCLDRRSSNPMSKTENFQVDINVSNTSSSSVKMAI